jgi:hypothetical protein
MDGGLQVGTEVNAYADGSNSIYVWFAGGQSLTNSEYKPRSLVEAKVRSSTASAIQDRQDQQDEDGKVRRLSKKRRHSAQTRAQHFASGRALFQSLLFSDVLEMPMTSCWRQQGPLELRCCGGGLRVRMKEGENWVGGGGLAARWNREFVRFLLHCRPTRLASSASGTYFWPVSLVSPLLNSILDFKLKLLLFQLLRHKHKRYKTFVI